MKTHQLFRLAAFSIVLALIAGNSNAQQFIPPSASSRGAAQHFNGHPLPPSMRFAQYDPRTNATAADVRAAQWARENARIEALRIEALRIEALRIEAARAEVARAEAARREVARLEAARAAAVRRNLQPVAFRTSPTVSPADYRPSLNPYYQSVAEHQFDEDRLRHQIAHAVGQQGIAAGGCHAPAAPVAPVGYGTPASYAPAYVAPVSPPYPQPVYRGQSPYYLGKGLFGQTTRYVDGQPVRNLFRALNL
ncbi:MAG: hypothetical protein KDA60_18315 [Planctomycetales bacterium]|nr:hypothetical protein [Planctomycetales bacterium]